MDFSILIPTYNRKEKLRLALSALKEQEGLDHREVIVGIDGSEDGTKEMLEDLKKTFPARLSFFWIENSGRAIIRNKLIEQAQGKLLLFIQDDIVVEKGWLQAHLKAQEKTPGIVVGHITWYPKMTITPYMRWLEKGGPLFDFSSYRDADEMDFWHCYTSNVSLPKNFLQNLSFDERLSGYGWEDIVLGYQLSLRGHKIFYGQKALAYHYHEHEEKNLKSYGREIGKNAAKVQLFYPDIKLIPSWWKTAGFYLLLPFVKMFSFLLPEELKWYFTFKEYFLLGISESHYIFSRAEFQTND